MYTVIKGLLLYFWKGVVFLYEYLLKMPFQATNRTYFWVFEFLLRFLKRYGVVGELAFTIFGLVWLLWPLALGYAFGMV